VPEYIRTLESTALYPLDRRLGGIQNRSGLRPLSVVQPVDNRYTDCTSLLVQQCIKILLSNRDYEQCEALNTAEERLRAVMKFLSASGVKYLTSFSCDSMTISVR
jgi:hypothetical protein